MTASWTPILVAIPVDRGRAMTTMLKFEVADAQKALQMATRDDVPPAPTAGDFEVDGGCENDLSCDGCRS